MTAEPCLRAVLQEPPLPIWHPDWSQTLVPWHIINSRAPTGVRMLGSGLLSPSFGGENHINKGESSDTFWEAKQQTEGKIQSFFHGLEGAVTLPGVFCGITYFLNSALVSCRWWGGLSMCSLLPLHRARKCSVGFWSWFSFLPRKIFPLFFLNLPQIFTSESKTKQTNQWDELSWLEHGADDANNSKGVGLIPVWAIYWRAGLNDSCGFNDSLPNQNILWSCELKINITSVGLVVSSMTQQQKQTGRVWRSPSCAHQSGVSWEV